MPFFDPTLPKTYHIHAASATVSTGHKKNWMSCTLVNQRYQDMHLARFQQIDRQPNYLTQCILRMRITYNAIMQIITHNIPNKNTSKKLLHTKSLHLNMEIIIFWIQHLFLNAECSNAQRNWQQRFGNLTNCLRQSSFHEADKYVD